MGFCLMVRSLLFSFFIIFLLGCESYNNVNHTPSVIGEMVDNEAWYSDANTDVLTMRVQIPVPNSALCAPHDDKFAPPRPCTFEDVQNDIDGNDDYKPELHVIMSTDSFANGLNTPNAVLKQRGNFSRTLEQKSYSIKLDSKTDLLQKQRRFQLNKHQSDRSRSKNKLAFDTFRLIPNISSLKTQFVNLYIDDVDYGLFTHVEAMREEFLNNRGWNSDDRLYNANNFIFEAISHLLVDASGDPIDPIAFESVLEIKNGDNHSNVDAMVKAIDQTDNIDDVIAKYFNRENYITWLASNLVFANQDTVQHNFFLYNPLYSTVFYFLPWDYDGAWAKAANLGKNEYGIAVWWNSPLHRKFLSVARNRNDVYARADQLRLDYISTVNLQSNLDAYANTIEPFIISLPDSANNSLNSWTRATNDLVSSIDDNIQLYKSVIGHPMPFDQRLNYSNSTLSVNWDVSVDFEGDQIVYDLNIARDYDFVDVVVSQTNIQGTSFTQDINLAPGTYYLKVTSKELNDPSHYQISYDRLRTVDGTKYGILAFEVQ